MATTNVPLSPELADALARFLAETNAKIATEWASKKHPFSAPTLETSDGGRYVRVIRNDGTSRSAYGFVDKTNGDLLKSAGWKAPAKGPRGNLLAGDWKRAGVISVR